MRKFLTGAAAVLAIALPGAANAASGYLGVDAATQEVNNGGGGNTDDTADAFGVDGAVFFDLGGTGLEVDASVLDSDDTDTTAAITAHLFSRNDDHLFGGFITYADNDEDSAWVAGLEANKYFDRWTLNGSIGYGEADDVTSTGVDVGVSMFASDNVRVDVGVGYVDADPDVGAGDTAMTYGVGGEIGFGAISIGLAWNHLEFDSNNADSDTLAAAVRFNFGTESLFDRDRHGASQAGRTALGSVLQAN